MGKKKDKKHGKGASRASERVAEPAAQAAPGAPAAEQPERAETAQAASEAPAAEQAAPDSPAPVSEPVREYRLKFYLNAQHYVAFDGKRGQTHPHTWEFTLVIEVSGLETTPFSAFERGVEDYLAPYQNKVMNEQEPFDTMLPTLENLVEEFARPFGEIVAAAGGSLVSLEGSEGPTRAYILRMRREAQEQFERQDLRAERARVIDGIVAEALGE